MKAIVTTALLAVLTLGLVATTASAYTLRSPQVTFDSTQLQGYFGGIGETFNVTTDQADVQVWSKTITGNSDFTIMKKNGVNDEVGVYNSSDSSPTPTLFQIFPSAAADNWYASVHFGTTGMRVTLFDQDANIQGQVTYPVDPNSFGFYIKSVNGTYYSQDGRNGRAMVLTYAGKTYPEWYLCFQDVTYPQANCTFNSVVVALESVLPTPTKATTWGKVKALYR